MPYVNSQGIVVTQPPLTKQAADFLWGLVNTVKLLFGSLCETRKQPSVGGGARPANRDRIGGAAGAAPGSGGNSRGGGGSNVRSVANFKPDPCAVKGG